MFLFFKQKTAYEMRISDWSSDVCSSDLFDARWQRLRNLIKLGRYVLRHDTTVFVDEHEVGADHRFLAVPAACAGAQIAANPDIGDLAVSDRHASARRCNRVPDLIDRTHPRIDSDDVGFAAPIVKVGEIGRAHV